jgi:hypothetical protein
LARTRPILFFQSEGSIHIARAIMRSLIPQLSSCCIYKPDKKKENVIFVWLGVLMWVTIKHDRLLNIPCCCIYKLDKKREGHIRVVRCSDVGNKPTIKHGQFFYTNQKKNYYSTGLFHFIFVCFVSYLILTSSVAGLTKIIKAWHHA